MEISTFRPATIFLLLFPLLLPAQPIADFQASDTEGCAPLVVNFQDLSQGNIVSWQWNLGTSTSTLQHPGAFYQNPGSYTIQLIVTDAQGLSDTLTRTQYINGYAYPTVQFQPSQTNVCAYEPVQFTDLSQAGSGSITQWTWDFGNGQTSNLSHPTVSYAQPGVYPVSLIVANQYGCEEDLIINQLISVQAPDVGFSADQQLACGPPLTVSFTSQGTQSGTHFWFLGDGSSSNQVNPVHNYTQNGTFDVSHIVEDAQGCRDTLTKQAFINIGVNTLSIYASDSSICEKDTVFFFTNATSNSQVLWDFDDGTIDSVLNPAHVFPAPGTYQVSATISDQSGCTNTFVLPITVNGFPTTSYTVADTNIGCELPFQVQFVNQSTNGQTWLWNFGDGNTSTAQNPTHIYTQADSFTVTLQAFGPGGCRRSLRKPDYVVVQPVKAGFFADPRGGCAPQPITFVDTTHSVFPITSWEWDYGDGNTGTGFQPVNVYQNPGTYDIELIIENSAGCRDTAFQQGYVAAGVQPNINFAADTNLACALTEIQFNNLTTGANQYTWYFGDGDTSMAVHPKHGFAALGDVDVMLVAADRGCRDTLYMPDYVHILAPLPIIGLSDKKLCQAPQDILFQNLSIGADYWSWELEDGFTTTDSAFVHPINDVGYFGLSLTVGNNSTGCEVTADDSLAVFPIVAGFTQDTTQGCVPIRIQFADTSNLPVQWFWDFGTGDTSALPNPSHLYDSAGFYDVSLIVRNNMKCYDTLTQVAHIRALEAQADFVITSPPVGCLPLTVDFEDRSGGTGTIVDWFWDFGDGNTSAQQHPTHTYASPGYFTVSLTVTDSDGCSHSYTLTDGVFATQPVADFNVNPSVNCPAYSNTFISLSTGHGLSYRWDFGDGSGSMLANTFHAYTDTGFYDISLHVTDVNGCQDSITRFKQVEVRELIASFVADTTYATCPPLTVSFLADSTYHHPNLSWHWDFGDGATGNQAAVTHVYTQAGQYDVSLILQSSTGCADSVSVSKMIVIEGPTATIDFNPGEGCPGESFQFNALSSYPVQYKWLFGDGSTQFGQNVSYSYDDPGIYLPVLMIEDSLGCQVFTAADSMIEVFSPPVSDFSSDLVQLCDSGTVRFYDQSTTTTNIVSYEWHFGDGQTSTLPSPTHLYQQIGSYDVSLITFSQEGCSDTLVMEDYIRVYPSPELSMQYQPGDEICLGDSLWLRASSNLHPYALQSYSWDLNDGSGLPSTPSLSHRYNQAGVYVPRLNVTDENGCSTSVSQVITVHALPAVQFSADDTLGCAPFPVQFSNLTRGGIFNSHWDFGDGEQSNELNPAHLYAQNGIYTVSLTVSDSNQCQATLTKTEYIRLDIPTAQFSLSDSVVCPGTSINFNDLSTSGQTLVDWQWDFGDGNGSSQQDPTHDYAQSGFYPVSLTVTDQLGCSHTLIQDSAIEVVRDAMPKVLPIQYVSVVNANTVEIVYDAFPNVYQDFGAYIIYRQGNNGYQEIARITDMAQLRYLDQNAQPELKSECYKIVVENSCGTSYDLVQADEHCTIALNSTAMEDEVFLDWNAYQGWDQVSEYRVFRVEDYQATQRVLIATMPGTTREYLDQDIHCYDDYSYQVEALAGDGRSSLSDTAHAQPIHLPPTEAAHTARVSVEANAFLNVEWALPQIDNPLEVVVERDAGQGYREVLRENLRQGRTKFNDQEADFQQGAFGYRVFVMDTCGDYTPVGREGVSIFLTTRQVGQSVELNWTPYRGWEHGVAEYQVQYFDPNTQAFRTIASLGGQETRYRDDALVQLSGEACYRILATEWEGGLETSYSNESCAILSGQIMGANAFSPNEDGHNDEFALLGVFLESYQIVIYNRWGKKVFESQSMDNSWNGLDPQGQACAEGVYVYIAEGVGIDGQYIKRVGSVTLLR